MSHSARPGEWVTLALLGRTRGRRGELLATSFTSGANRFQAGQTVYLFGGAGTPRPAEVEQVWEYRGALVFKFRGIDTISDAEAWQGAEVRLPLSERAPLPEGEYYQSDLVGCEVVEESAGGSLGVVTGWQEGGGPLLLEVRGSERTFLIPFAKSICRNIDLAQRRILVELPEGLKELE